MSLSDVLASISWRAPGNQWPLIGRPVGDVADQGILTGFITAAYASPIAAGLMEQAAATGTIRIGASGAAEPGSYSGYFDTPGSYLGLNSSAIGKLHYFNTTGTFVKEKGAITVAHEFVHFVLKSTYADPPYSESAMNGAAYDFDHPIIVKQNEISTQLGELNNLQVSYFSSIMQGFDLRFNQLTVGHSYTDGKVVDVVRLGDAVSDGVGDDIDHTLRTTKLNDLLFGFGGDDTIKAGKGDDYVYGGADKDKIWGGEGNDVLVGQSGDDEFHGEKGNDTIWGGEKDSTTHGTADGTDLVDYSLAPAEIVVTWAGGAIPSLTANDGEDGIDTLHSIERIAATSHSDMFGLSGTGSATIDLTNLVDGFALVTRADLSIRIKSFESFAGGESLTTFIGKAGTPATFMAGSGGGDFTLTAGDHAYGYDDVQDTYRVTTTVPAEFASYTEAEKASYLALNRVFIGNFGAEDRIFVNGVLFDGNNVTSALAPTVASDYNRDLPITYAVLTGDSSYGTAYAQASFDVRGQSWGGEDWGLYAFASGRIRDVSFARGDSHEVQEEDERIDLITFMSRAITPYDDGSNTGYTLDPLSSADEMLTIVIQGFSDGDGGISFSNDALANFDRPTPYSPAEQVHSYVHGLNWSDTQQIPIAPDYDIDGNVDGYLEVGGPAIGSDDPRFNLGERPLDNAGSEWQDFVGGGDRLSGTVGNDTIDAGVGNDRVYGGDGDDTLIGGEGNDKLYGEAGSDLLIGNGGDDLLDGGDDADTMQGGAGNDTYYVEDADDIVSENASEGSDTVITNLATYALGAQIENLIYQGTSAFSGTGNALDNLLQGGEGDDMLSGGGGNDSFQSSGGSDLLDGGDGFDVLRIAGSIWSISISVDGGAITVTDYNQWNSSAVLTGMEAIYLSDEHVTYTIAELLDRSVTGTSGNDAMIAGNGLDNEIYGLAGDDVLRGAGGYDVLDGGIGMDTAWFAGNSADYQAYFDTDGNIRVDDLVGSEGSDQLIDVEVMYFAGDDRTIQVDLPPLGTSGNDVLTGNDNRNVLFGLEGDDIVDGLAGDDTLIGGEGNDSYLLGLGHDSVSDDGGNDAYFYSVGDGIDGISDYTGADYLEFGAGIIPDDVMVTQADGTYTLTFAAMDGGIWIWNGVEEDYALEEIHFADSTIWTAQDLYDMAFSQSLAGGGAGELAHLAFWETSEPAFLTTYYPYMADFHIP